MRADETIACRMTPAGRGALATVLVFGPNAVACVDQQFQPRRAVELDRIRLGRILFGNWSPNETPSEGGVGEEIVVCKADWDRVEIHCHGGHAAVQAILDSLQQHGCRIADWSELPPGNRIEQDARRALGSARTENVAGILLDQRRGTLAAAIARIDESLAREDSVTASDLLDALLHYETFGCRLTSPWQVAIVGAPNAGKSSLINAIVGFQRAIVFDSPGTTRDVVTVGTAIDGWPVEFADTAGIRHTDDAIESAGVARSMEQLKLSDLVIIVLDAAEPIAREIQVLLEDFPEALVVQNKIDLVASPPTMSRAAWPTSATGGDGLPELLTEISQRLIGQPPSPGTAIPFAKAQFDDLRVIRLAVERGEWQQARRGLDHFRTRNAT